VSVQNGWGRVSYPTSGWVLCLATVIVTVCSCAAPPQSLVTDGFLDGAECSPPCWQGLVPGVSTEQDIIQFLDTRQQQVDPFSVERDSHDGAVVVRWRTTRQTQGENWFELHNGVLQTMNLHMDSPLTLGELLEAFGAPDKLEAGYSVESGPVHIVVDMFYGRLGLAPELYVATDDPVLRESTPVVRTWIFEPGTLQDFYTVLVGEKGEPLPDYALQWLRDWRDWPGYGPLRLTY
jgi:hypothetical protein